MTDPLGLAPRLPRVASAIADELAALAARADEPAAAARPSRIALPLQPLQVRAQLRRHLVPHVAVFLQRLVQDSLELCGQARIQRHRRNRRVVQNLVENYRAGRSRKRSFVRSPSDTALRPAKTNPSAHPALRRVLVPATYMRSFRPPSPDSSNAFHPDRSSRLRWSSPIRRGPASPARNPEFWPARAPSQKYLPA